MGEKDRWRRRKEEGGVFVPLVGVIEVQLWGIDRCSLLQYSVEV